MIRLPLASLLLVALCGCRPSGGEPAPQPAPPPPTATPKPAPAPAPPPTPERPTMHPLPADRVEMKLPTDDREGWEAAFAAYIARAKVGDSILQKPGIISRLEPLADPDGRTLPYLFTDRVGNARSINLMHGVTYIERTAGEAAAARYFADVHPAKHGASRHLVGQALYQLGVLSTDFHPIAHSWALFDERFEENGLPTPTLVCEDGGCVYTAEARIEPPGAGGGDVEWQHVRVRVHIAPDGALKIERQKL